jgi:hypothetical protein
MGHGFGIYKGATRRYECLVAFVDGFKWLRGRGATEAVVRFDPRRVPTGEQQFAAFKAAIEARIRAGDASQSEIVPGYWGGANA